MTDTNPVEEMASFEVLHTQDSSGTFESNEYSFLPEVSNAQIPNGTLNHINEDLDLTNMQSALTAVPDKCVEEVHSHLMELLEENQSLKEALNKNNSMMKEQMSTISQWREQMIISRNQQQLNLQKEKEKASELEKENCELHKKIESLEKTGQLKAESDICAKCKVSVTADNLSNENNVDHKICERAESKEEMFHDQIVSCLSAVTQYLENLVCESKVPDKEKKDFTDLCVLLKRNMNTLDQYNTIVQTDEENGYEVVHKGHKDKNEVTLVQNSKGQDEVESFRKIIEQQKTELEFLRKQEQELAGKLKASEIKLQEYEMALKSRYEEMNNKLDIESSLADKYKERCESLQQQVDEYQTKLEKAKMSDNHEIQDLHEEIKDLRDILKLEQNANQMDKEKLHEVMVKCENLQVDHDRVTKLLEIQSKDQKRKSEELTSLRENEAKTHQEKIDHLMAQICDLEQKLEEKNEEVEKLATELSTSKDDLETIPILKSQIEVYKLDVEDAISQKNVAEDKVTHLTNELKKYRREDSDSSSPSFVSRRRHSKKDDAATSLFQCPLCQMGFSKEQAVTNHVEKCMAEKGYQ